MDGRGRMIRLLHVTRVQIRWKLKSDGMAGMNEVETLQSIHRVFINFNRRAERSSDENLVATFVDSAPLFDLLSTQNNQVIYGRRGTGKTHALKYLAEKVDDKNEISVYLDLRSVGSNSSIYSDAGRPLPERTSTLILDVVGAIKEELFGITVSLIDKHPHPDELTRRLDALQASLTEVKVVGQSEMESLEGKSEKKASGIAAALNIFPVPALSASAKSDSEKSNSSSERVRRTGVESVHITFGSVSSALADLIYALKLKRLWLLVDEWSEVPVDLQPYLADFIKRIILPINEITIKIAAIEHRSNFRIIQDRGAYIGLELGADVAADLNLDDFLVFDNSQEKSVNFVKSLIFNHYNSSEEKVIDFVNPDDLIQAAFTQHNVFEEFVRAVEGVPRDALNLASKMATKGFGQRIAMAHVRGAARDWYNQDKSAAIRSDQQLGDVLAHIVDNVIGKRRARAFLFPSNNKHDGIEKLFDSRLLHVLKRNVSSHDRPGFRFDVYKIDYGCYVDLINTTKAPEGLFEIEDEGGVDKYVDVPKDDYRSIRRAILDSSDLLTTQV